MTPEAAVQIIREALLAAFGLAAPLLLIGFGVGIIMNLVQVATSLQDSAFSTFPRPSRSSCSSWSMAGILSWARWSNLSIRNSS